MSMGLSALDFEIRSLSMDDNCIELRMVMTWLIYQFEARTYFDLTEAVLNIFLKEYYSMIKLDTDLLNQTKEVYSLHRKAYKELKALHNYNVCLIQYFSGEK